MQPTEALHFKRGLGGLPLGFPDSPGIKPRPVHPPRRPPSLFLCCFPVVLHDSIASPRCFPLFFLTQAPRGPRDTLRAVVLLEHRRAASWHQLGTKTRVRMGVFEMTSRAVLQHTPIGRFENELSKHGKCLPDEES